MNKFEIVTGNEKNKHAGVSIFKEEDGIYKIHLNILPNVTYFMQKNKSGSALTIFSRKVKTGTETKLLNPVGYGRILKDLKTHMQLHFEVLNTNLYMSLFPKA